VLKAQSATESLLDNQLGEEYYLPTSEEHSIKDVLAAMSAAEAAQQELMTTGALGQAAAAGNQVLADVLSIHSMLQRLYHKAYTALLQHYGQSALTPAGAYLIITFHNALCSCTWALQPAVPAVVYQHGYSSIRYSDWNCTNTAKHVHISFKQGVSPFRGNAVWPGGHIAPLSSQLTRPELTPKIGTQAGAANAGCTTLGKLIMFVDCAGLAWCIACEAVGDAPQPGVAVPEEVLKKALAATLYIDSKSGRSLSELAGNMLEAAPSLTKYNVPGVCVMPDMLTAISTGFSLHADGAGPCAKAAGGQQGATKQSADKADSSGSQGLQYVRSQFEQLLLACTAAQEGAQWEQQEALSTAGLVSLLSGCVGPQTCHSVSHSVASCATAAELHAVLPLFCSLPVASGGSQAHFFCRSCHQAASPFEPCNHANAQSLYVASATNSRCCLRCCRLAIAPGRGNLVIATSWLLMPVIFTLPFGDLEGLMAAEGKLLACLHQMRMHTHADGRSPAVLEGTCLYLRLAALDAAVRQITLSTVLQQLEGSRELGDWGPALEVSLNPFAHGNSCCVDADAIR
jgi:hypothetical protein